MVFKALFTAILVLFSCLLILATCSSVHNYSPLISNGSFLAGIDMADQNFNVVTSSATDCGFSNPDHRNEESKKRVGVNYGKPLEEPHVVKLPVKRRISGKLDGRQSVIESTLRDLNRIHTFRRRILENKNQNAPSRLSNHRQLLEEHPTEVDAFPGHLVGSLKSGVSLGSGEYFIDVYLGTPPKHYLLILDTGSDLNWIQCVPCYDCFEQDGPHYDPKFSTSFQNISCKDPRCDLVSAPDPPRPCKGVNQSCPYFYWYGDSSNTTGDFALETFTVNLTSSDGKSEFKKVENVMFGCGHWNRGLFHGASGLLGLGRGPLSFSSQLKSLYGHSFSYCLVDRNSDPTVSSKLIFGEDKELLAHPQLSFTKLLNGKDNPVDTFYYVDIKAISVGGETLNIPKEMWGFTENGGGGTIIDSGSTLSYFVEPAYEVIKEAFIKKIRKYSLVTDFPVLKPCYNVSGISNLELPSFKIHFSDGAEWNFPIQNYFIWVDQEVVCLALMPSKTSPFSIIGNYQQQNFHILYDTKKSRLGFAPTKCADV
ncbi:aspartyl protease family protein 2-like isoform X2 [Silene latifolia]